MTCLFASSGRVVGIMAEDTALPMSMDLECWPRDGGRRFKAVITQVGVSSQGGYQFMHSLRQYVYIYVFGERIGEVVMSGFTFTGGCLDTAASGLPASGIECVLAYYNMMRATKRPCPVSIRVGSLAFRGFLLAVRADVSDADTGLGHFTFRFHTPPGDVTGIGGLPCATSAGTACILPGAFEVPPMMPGLDYLLPAVPPSHG